MWWLALRRDPEFWAALAIALVSLVVVVVLSLVKGYSVLVTLVGMPGMLFFFAPRLAHAVERAGKTAHAATLAEKCEQRVPSQ